MRWANHCLTNWALSSEFVTSSIPSWQILTAHAQPFRGARDLAFCLKVPLDSLLVWASSGGSGETAQMRRLAWTFTARIGDKYQIRLTRPSLWSVWFILFVFEPWHDKTNKMSVRPAKTQFSLGICPVCSSDSCECQTLHNYCPRHILQARTMSRYPWPRFRVPVTLSWFYVESSIKVRL